jgi:uncharacterized membrane protein
MPVPRWPLRTGVWLVVALAASALLALFHSPLVPLPGVVSLLLIPGATVMSALRTRPANTSGRIVLAVSLSLLVIMVIGGLVSLLGPHLGLAHPLDALPERIIWAVLGVLVLVTGAIMRRDPATWIFEGIRSAQIGGALALGILPVVAILGVAQLNYSGNNRLAVFSTILDVVALLIGIVGGWQRQSRWPLATLLYFATLALLLSTSLRGGHLYGWDIQQEFGVASHTIGAGVWVIPLNHDPYASMLSLTVLPATLHSLVKLHLTAFFQLVVPAMLALLPVALYSAARFVPRWVTSDRRNPRPGLAFGVVAGLVLWNALLTSLIVSITRQAMALTIFSALVMVMFDRTMPKRSSQVVVGLLIVAISFTHYSTSYLLAGILLVTWLVVLLWSRGWLFTRRSANQIPRSESQSRNIVNGVLVFLGFGAAFGWNVGITRNNALSNPSGAVASSGLGLSTSSGNSSLSVSKVEKLLVSELHKTAKWLVPVPGSNSIHLVSAAAPSSPGIVPRLGIWWPRLNFVAHEALWVVAGVAILYGVFYLGRRRSDQYSSEIVGLGVAGLIVGVAFRFSGTLATFYNPERGAIVAAILLAVPLTMILDDVAARFSLVSSIAGTFFAALLALWATGLGTLFFGGQAPASIVARGEDVEQFTVSAPEVATAKWLRDTLSSSRDLVQCDRYGQLVLLSEPGRYGFLPEIVPPEVDQTAYVYLSTVNVIDGRSSFAADDSRYISIYRSNLIFFKRNFSVVYSTGVTRVYH